MILLVNAAGSVVGKGKYTEENVGGVKYEDFKKSWDFLESLNIKDASVPDNVVKTLCSNDPQGTVLHQEFNN